VTIFGEARMHRFSARTLFVLASAGATVPLHAGVMSQPIGFAVLQFPPSATITACPKSGESTLAFGQVYVAGVTDASSVPATGIVAQIGVVATGSDPAAAPASAWVDAIPDPGFDFSGNNDEYEAYLYAHASGSFDYAYRFSYDAAEFVYADTGLGSSDGYSSADAGKLTVSGNVIYCDRFEGLSP
jgi:hypothetical protein